MRVAVISPYYKESPEWLEQCHASVRAQTHSCTHFLIADGFPQTQVDQWDAQHIKLAKSHGEGGDFPRSTGALSAIRQGFDAVTFVDADNWLYPDHIEHMVELFRTDKPDVCVAKRTIHKLDGSTLNREEPFKDSPLYDANCIFLTRSAFFIAHLWAAIPIELGCISDRVVSLAINGHRLKVARGDHPTVACRTAYIDDYLSAGETPPAEAKTVDPIGRATQHWRSLSDADRKRILRTDYVRER